VAVLLNDITPRHEAEERQKAIFEIQTVGVMFWGKGFGLTAMNDAFLRMTGFTREEAMGKTWQELTPTEFYPESWHAVNEVTTKGEATPYEKQYFRKDGSRWWGLFAARRIGDEVVEFVLDVSQRREAETALRAADERKDVFLATLAHELRNPLAPLSNGLQIARLGGMSDDPRTRRTIDMMERQLTHLVRLVDDLMDVGRIAAGKLELKREPVQLANVLAASVEAARDVIERHGHRLEVQAPAQSLEVLGDFERLAQVFVNLLINAAKYTQPEGLIQLTLSREGEHAIVQVTDNGIGIPAEEAERVFDLFSQVRKHQERTEGGLGIGLALVKSLVTSHGGEVYAYSAGPGRGSRFTVSLPLMHQQPAPSAVAPPRATRSGANVRRVVVADDNEDAAGSLAELLRIGGHDVRTAHDGREAVQVVQEFGPDIVILDLGMPHVDGFEAARRIRSLEQGKHVTMVALSGWGQDADRARSRAAGFDHHLTKPANVATLEAIFLGRPLV
jgi:PAS domain S-box-containing protein